MTNELITPTSTKMDALNTLVNKIPEEVIRKYAPVLIFAGVAVYAIDRHYRYLEANSAMEHGYNYTNGSTSFNKSEVVAN